MARGSKPPQRKPDFKVVQLSGLWDAHRDRWAAAMSAAMRAGDVVLITEFTQTPLADEWFENRGWGLIHFTGPGRTECAIAYDRDIFDDPRRWCIPISTTPYALGSGKIRPRVHLTGAELRHRATGQGVNFDVFHSPSAIEGRNALIRGVRRSKAMLECFSGIQAHRKAELRGEPSVLGADWNLDLIKAWVRALLRTRLRGWRNSWRKLPANGSHGKRLIDGFRHSRQLRCISCRLMSRIAPFDHRMVVGEFVFA